ncbi:MAG: WxL domain-containing protein [Streptococcaceae bacterium]|jgi:hypothetical protein|nr:WxL domain-containing protein [Streptococcaceae bacterium]
MTKLSLASAILLGSVLVGTAMSTTTFAAEQTYTSKGSITYTPSTGPVTPVDPENPDKPVIPTDPELPINPGTNGPLSIDFASNFRFGKQEITSVDKVYDAQAQELSDGTTRANYVQVTDNRGTLAGWTLTAKASEFTDQDMNAVAGSTGYVLEGAQITLTGGNIQTSSKAPATVVKAEETLLPGQSSSVLLGAKDGEGAGTNLLVFGDTSSAATSVKLAVPGKSTKLATNYQSTITWTLADTPAV